MFKAISRTAHNCETCLPKLARSFSKTSNQYVISIFKKPGQENWELLDEKPFPFKLVDISQAESLEGRVKTETGLHNTTIYLKVNGTAYAPISVIGGKQP